RVIVNGTGGDDTITISVDPVTGVQTVTVNGVSYEVPKGQEVVVRGGDGNDTITVPRGGGITFTLIGSGGSDNLTGGDGSDTLLGGSGDDVSYAGRGNDTTQGGTGTDTANGEVGDADDGVESTVTIEIPDGLAGITIEGSPEFVERVQADLQMLAGSP